MNCSIEDIIQTHNKYLCGMLGNFVNRNLSFINKKFEGIIKEGTIDSEIIEKTKEAYQSIGHAFENAEIRNATTQIIEYISLANKYYDSMEPWIKAKEDIKAFNDVTYTCVYMMANMANLIAPIMMDGSKKIKEMLNLKDFKWEEEKIQGDYKINNLAILYNKKEEE
jgi:methionyl-tRNA synthetase